MMLPPTVPVALLVNMSVVRKCRYAYVGRHVDLGLQRPDRIGAEPAVLLTKQ